MGKQVKRSKAEIPTIDCSLITIETEEGEFGFDTANSLGVEPQLDEQEATTLIIKGILRAQKPAKTTITGHQLTLTDNVFNPELVMILQGGIIIYDSNDPNKIVGYEPPVVGSTDKGQVFRLNGYSAQYDASGQIVQYEKISYPNCTGVPVAFSTEDGTFRAPEYAVNSAPKKGEAPYRISYVPDLPALVDEFVLSELTIMSTASSTAGSTVINVTPGKFEYSNKYVYKTDVAEIQLPAYGVTLQGYTEWDGISEIVAVSGNNIAVIELDSNGKAVAGGKTVVVSN